jgi:hypothetical protein
MKAHTSNQFMVETVEFFEKQVKLLTQSDELKKVVSKLKVLAPVVNAHVTQMEEEVKKGNKDILNQPVPPEIHEYRELVTQFNSEVIGAIVPAFILNFLQGRDFMTRYASEALLQAMIQLDPKDETGYRRHN